MSEATRYIDEGLAYCSERGLELFRLYLLADRAQPRARRRGAARMPPIPPRSCFASIAPRRRRAFSRSSCSGSSARAAATPVSRRCSTRRGRSRRRPGSCRVSRPSQRRRAEAAWLEGDRAAVDAGNGERPRPGDRAWCRVAGPASSRRGAGVQASTWMRRPRAAEPYALELAGDFVGAAALWADLGCPYEAALALAGADDEEPLRRSLDELQRLGAQADGGDRRPPPAGARRPRPRARTAAVDEAEPVRPDAARARGARARRGRAVERPDRRPLRALGTDGRPPRRRRAPQARGSNARRGGSERDPPRARRTR